MDAFCLFICLSAYSVVDYLIKSSDINDIPESIRVVVTRDKPMLKLISVSKQLFNILATSLRPMPCNVTIQQQKYLINAPHHNVRRVAAQLLQIRL